MIHKIPAKDRHYQDMGFLKTFWLFSFSNYHDPQNMNFGSLRVFNDDIVMPGAGFPEHPHETMEIVTIVLEGILTHKDDMGNEEIITAGEIQRMSAGEGVVHSEFNHHDEPVHLYQLWFYPNQQTEADYEQMRIAPGQTGLTLIASDVPDENVLSIKADAKIFSLTLVDDQVCEFDISSQKGLFVYVHTGTLIILGETYQAGDQARITGPESLTFAAENGSATALVIEVKI